MTFGQRMNSMFGLVDTGANAPPPPPPPNTPNYGQRRPQHTTVPNGKQPANTSSIPHNAAYSSGGVQPPVPRRDNGAAQTPATPAEEPLPDTQDTQAAPKSSILMQSRAGAGQAAPAIRPAANKPTTAAAPVPTAASEAASENAPVMQAPVNGSRRRPLSQRTTTEPLTENAAPPVEEVPVATTPSAPNTTANSTAKPTPAAEEVFVPSIPMMADRRASGTPSSIPTQSTPTSPNTTSSNTASSKSSTSNAPATLPVETTTTASRPLAAQPKASTPSAPPAAPSPMRDSAVATSTPPASAEVDRSAVLAAFTSPEVTVETVGPRRISIGREATYRVQVRNRGKSAAQQVVVSLNIPVWAEVVEMHGTSGNTTSADEHEANTPLQWQLDVLDGGGEEELTLVLIPRKSETFDLGVRWTCSPAAVATAIEVEEPRLQMAINGPSEVSFGEQRLYKLTVSNPGTGTAENVVLHLMPLSPNDGEAVSHKIGDLKAGQDTSVEVELTARQAGNLKIRTAASADGNLKTEAAADVVVHRAALDVAIVAPKVVFAGVPGNYEVRVRNTGDDQARNLRLTVDLPHGTKLLTALPAPKTEVKGNQAHWTIERLAPGAEQVFSLRCSLESGGAQQLTATTSADGDLRKTAQASTDVQSVADLALDVIDTPGPVAVGQPVTYEIHVKNRGMKSAEGVDIVAYFSDGIEPEKAEGQAHELQPGMVVFKSLSIVGAGQDRVLRVTARATAAGNHRLRVELHSRTPQTQLSHEDATFFYLDEAPNSTVSENGTPSNGSTSSNSQSNGSANGSSTNSTVEHARALRSTTRSNGASLQSVPPANTGATPASDNRYGNAEQAIPANIPQMAEPVRPAASVGAANAPGTVFPAAVPQRHRTNGLR
ncbi:MAG: DUF11 domain-containing protein [Planctomycetia bacterium]|nr:DUF11 domain-containing protein [Planctomycetia bacterium]